MRKVLFILLGLTLVACGGGEGNSTPTSGLKDTVVSKTEMTLIDTLMILRPDSALRLLNISLASNPTNVELLNKRGFTHIKLIPLTGDPGHIVPAMDDFRQAAKLGGEELKSYMGLAECFSYVPNDDSTFYYLNEALKINQNFAPAYQMKGIVYLRQGDTLAARTSFQTAIEQDPYLFTSYDALGEIYKASGHEAALGYYESAARYAPTSVQVQYNYAINLQNYGERYLEEGDEQKAQPKIEKALDIYDTILQLDSNYAQAYFNKGYIELYMYSNKEKAAEYFERAGSLDDKNPATFYNLGYIAELNKDIVTANGYYQKCLTIDNGYTIAQEALRRINR